MMYKMKDLGKIYSKISAVKITEIKLKSLEILLAYNQNNKYYFYQFYIFIVFS